MLRVSIENACAGMILARPVTNPEAPDQILLKTAYELEEENIQRLKSLRVRGVWVRYPDLDFLDDTVPSELIDKNQALYNNLKTEMESVQDGSLSSMNYSVYMDKMREVVTEILNCATFSSTFVEELQGASNDIFLHGLRVASYAIFLGMQLDYYIIRERPKVSSAHAVDLSSLGMGCLLHDIGKLLLDEELRDFHLTASFLGDPEWQQHTEVGTELIRKGLDPSIGQVILNHHQHFDGSGFPGRKDNPIRRGQLDPLSGNDIHIFCRIAAIADRFEGLRYLPDGEYAPSIVALKRMKNPGYASWFDPVVYDTFMNSIMPFSVGEHVQLNNGQHAVVVETHPSNPCCPTVRFIDLNEAVGAGEASSQRAQGARNTEMAAADGQGENKAPGGSESATATEVAPNDAEQAEPSSSANAQHAVEAKKAKRNQNEINLETQAKLSIERVGGFDVTNYLY